jgi:hypothetical protein
MKQAPAAWATTTCVWLGLGAWPRENCHCSVQQQFSYACFAAAALFEVSRLAGAEALTVR